MRLSIPARFPLGLLVLIALALLSLPAAIPSDGASPAVSAGGEARSLGAPAGGRPFQRGELGVTIEQPTSLAFGPDGRLYVASETEIRALTLDPAGEEVLAEEQVASGLEGVLGLAFDPTAPASPVTVYASRQEPSAIPGFQGAVSTFTAPAWEREDVITGLPTSAPLLNHMTNGLAFDSQGRLYIAQGSATDAGLADPAGPQEYWPETPLSGAILVADIHDPSFDGRIIYDPPGPPADDNVDQVGGDVAVYAPGLRNAYDLVLHSNGYVYAADNGAMGKEYSLSCTEAGGMSSVADELNLIEQGNYYGFPNRNRGRFDPRQCTYHPPEEGSGPGFTGPIRRLPNHCSCDGIAEYPGTALDGAMEGDLVYTEFVLGNVSRAVLSQDGRTVVSISRLASGFTGPLDLTVGPNGTIYVAEYMGDRISYLAPPPATETPTATDTPPPTATSTQQPPATPTPQPTPTNSPRPTATPTHQPTATLTPTPPGAGLGDVDCDRTVSSIDAALVLQLSAGLIGSLRCPQNADTNQDGTVNAIDAALILQYVAGLIPALPPPRART